MHLLRTQPGGFVPDDGIAHLAQTPAELVILCSGDSHLALLAEAARALPDDYPSLRLANPMQLQNHASVDLYVEEVLRHARVILLSLHGGIGYWRYGVEQLVALAERGALLIPVPGDDRPDPELSALGNLPAEQAERFWQYLRQGGLENAGQFYRCLASQCLGRDYAWREPQALPRVALFHPRHAEATLEHWRADWQAGRPVVALLFYRTHLQAANTAFIARFLRTPRGAGAQPVADRAGQPQGKRLPGAGGRLAGAQRRRADRQYHRFRPVQSGGARVASVPSRRAGIAGDLLAGQPPALAGQPARPGAA